MWARLLATCRTSGVGFYRRQCSCRFLFHRKWMKSFHQTICRKRVNVNKNGYYILKQMRANTSSGEPILSTTTNCFPFPFQKGPNVQESQKEVTKMSYKYGGYSTCIFLPLQWRMHDSALSDWMTSLSILRTVVYRKQDTKVTEDKQRDIYKFVSQVIHFRMCWLTDG